MQMSDGRDLKPEHLIVHKRGTVIHRQNVLSFDLISPSDRNWDSFFGNNSGGRVTGYDPIFGHGLIDIDSGVRVVAGQHFLACFYHFHSILLSYQLLSFGDIFYWDRHIWFTSYHVREHQVLYLRRLQDLRLKHR